MGVQEKICRQVSGGQQPVQCIQGRSKIPNPCDKFFLTDVKAFNPKGLCFQAHCQGSGFVINTDLLSLNVCLYYFTREVHDMKHSQT